MICGLAAAGRVHRDASSFAIVEVGGGQRAYHICVFQSSPAGPAAAGPPARPRLTRELTAVPWRRGWPSTTRWRALPSWLSLSASHSSLTVPPHGTPRSPRWWPGVAATLWVESVGPARARARRPPRAGHGLAAHPMASVGWHGGRVWGRAHRKALAATLLETPHSSRTGALVRDDATNIALVECSARLVGGTRVRVRARPRTRGVCPSSRSPLRSPWQWERAARGRLWPKEDALPRWERTPRSRRLRVPPCRRAAPRPPPPLTPLPPPRRPTAA